MQRLIGGSSSFCFVLFRLKHESEQNSRFAEESDDLLHESTSSCVFIAEHLHTN